MVKIMPSIKHENRSPRVLVPLYSLNGALFLRSFSYHKLPQQLLKLSVLKLDGSSFGVHVAINATVAELKLSVEEVFSVLLMEGQTNISWSHVWGHFCMCYEGQKLINDKAFIQSFGIKDGDQLQFIRHMSINCKPAKQQSKSNSVTSRQCSMSSSESNAVEDIELSSAFEDQENNFRYHQYEEDEETPMPEFKLARILKGWLSHSRLWGTTRKGSKGGSCPSRFSFHH